MRRLPADSMPRVAIWLATPMASRPTWRAERRTFLPSLVRPMALRDLRSPTPMRPFLKDLPALLNSLATRFFLLGICEWQLHLRQLHIHWGGER